MPTHNLTVQRSLTLQTNNDPSLLLRTEDPELLVGSTESNKDFYSLLYFDLQKVIQDGVKPQLLGAYLLLNISTNNITANTASYQIKPLLQPWSDNILPNEIAASDLETVVFIIPFHWTESIMVDITQLTAGWWHGDCPNYGLLIQGNKSLNSLLGFHNIGYSSYELVPQLLLALDI